MSTPTKKEVTAAVRARLEEAQVALDAASQRIGVQPPGDSSGPGLHELHTAVAALLAAVKAIAVGK